MYKNIALQIDSPKIQFFCQAHVGTYRLQISRSLCLQIKYLRTRPLQRVDSTYYNLKNQWVQKVNSTRLPCVQPVRPYFVGPPTNLNGGRLPTGVVLSSSILSFVNSATIWWSVTFVTVSRCADKDTSVDAFPPHFPSTNLWPYCIVKSCHIPTSSLLAGAILRISTATNQLATCVPHVVR